MMNSIQHSKEAVVCGKDCYKAITTPAKTGLYEQAKDFITKLFDTTDWPPRWHCGNWTDFHGWLYILSDIMIGAAYYAIPVLLFRIVIKRKDIPFPKLFWLFIAFIALCGSTHLLDAIIFWWPAYRLSGAVRLLTGFVSFFTVIMLYKAWPMINNIRTLKQLETEIEERKKAEQEAQHQQILKEAAEDLMQKKDEFMSIASHELKTPITSVKATLQLVERVVVSEPSLQQVAPMVQKASKQVNKLTSIINDLLDVTKIQAGKLILAPTTFNLSDLITECAEQCSIGDSQHTITINGDSGFFAFGDPDRLEQVICNLITNAIKYSPNGKEVNIHYYLQGGDVRVEVTDHGIGIAKQQLENLFDRFFRVEHTSQNFSGLGLGLYISSEIVKHHQGEIGVISTPSVGSTFWFTLPQIKF
jgi:chemotaxis family two-component system sensor kinase Cph1